MMSGADAAPQGVHHKGGVHRSEEEAAEAAWKLYRAIRDLPTEDPPPLVPFAPQVVHLLHAEQSFSTAAVPGLLVLGDMCSLA